MASEILLKQSYLSPRQAPRRRNARLDQRRPSQDEQQDYLDLVSSNARRTVDMKSLIDQ